jgi:hypothetical protein
MEQSLCAEPALESSDRKNTPQEGDPSFLLPPSRRRMRMSFCASPDISAAASTTNEILL